MHRRLDSSKSLEITYRTIAQKKRKKKKKKVEAYYWCASNEEYICKMRINVQSFSYIQFMHRRLLYFYTVLTLGKMPTKKGKKKKIKKKKKIEIFNHKVLLCIACGTIHVHMNALASVIHMWINLGWILIYTHVSTWVCVCVCVGVHEDFSNVCNVELSRVCTLVYKIFIQGLW